MAMFYIATLLKALLGYAGLILQGENLDSGLTGCIRRRRCLSVAPFLKALLLKTSLSMWCHGIVGADMVIVVVLTIMDLIALGFFFCLAYA